MVYVKIFGIVLGTAILAGIIGLIGSFVLGSFCTCCGKCDYGSKNISEAVGNFVIFCTIAGAIFGAIYAIATEAPKQLKAEREAREDERIKLEEAQKRDRQAKEAAEKAKKEVELEQRKKIASEFKSNARNIIEKCKSNMEDSENIVPYFNNFESVSLQEKLWLVLNEVSIPMQKLKDIVSELASNAKEEK